MGKTGNKLPSANQKGDYQRGNDHLHHDLPEAHRKDEHFRKFSKSFNTMDF
jgi:hypothetical protein